ncbi:MAG: hypothetical protein FWF06_03740 [Symbiobacteriaceae bacterium]|nr:hypothetical protein [Symbiobacteriaceae bacterium]
MDNKQETVFKSASSAIYRLVVGEYEVEGVEVSLPGTSQFLLTINCQHGMLACRLVDLSVSDRLNLPLAIFSAARLENILIGKPVMLSQSAVSMGATKEMTGAELVSLFSQPLGG